MKEKLSLLSGRPPTTQFAATYNNAVNPAESQAKGQRDEDPHAVRKLCCMPWPLLTVLAVVLIMLGRRP
jgi:hypothetical protein